ncbi:MAG: peptidase M64, partial [Paramuribaculum sp.]|nr:peptidase M64 [Paramuribaculum sp.]
MRLLTLAIALTALGASATSNFNNHFCDSTLRVDYILSGKADNVSVSLYGQSKSEGWAGRR